MKALNNISIALLVIGLVLTSCRDKQQQVEHNHDHNKRQTKDHRYKHKEEYAEEIHLSSKQFAVLDIKMGKLTKKNIGEYIEANGKLEVPPQNEATVTAIIGANVAEIKVIEGDKVSKGQVLAYISHPELIQLQTDYLESYAQYQFLEKEFLRQQKLYAEKVNSGKSFQKIEADYLSAKGKLAGYKAQLKLLELNVNKIEEGEIYQRIPVKSPISGHIRTVEVKTGQYVDPQTEMFEIVNVDHIHADLMVFEKDAHKVSKGQTVVFTTQSMPGKELEATIYSVGRSFEENPKAIHLHAEIENEKGGLIPGMYVTGRILTKEAENYALPDEGVILEEDQHYIFIAQKEGDEWALKPLRVEVGNSSGGWTEVLLPDNFSDDSQVAFNKAYYLMAELKKGEGGHSHSH